MRGLNLSAGPGRRLMVGVGAVAAVAGAATFLWGFAGWSNRSTPIEVADAAAQFSSTAETAAALSLPTTASVAVGPTTSSPHRWTPGVYRVTSTGEEGIDVLTKPTRRYPAESAMVVTSADCGIRVDWRPLVERREWFEICPEGGGMRLVAYGSFHTFFDNDDERSLICPHDAWLVAPGATPGAVSITTCVGSGLVDVRTSTYVGPDVVVLDGLEIDVVVVEVAVVTSGDTVGTALRSLALTSSGMPLVWADQVAGTSDSVIGSVNYKEVFELRAQRSAPE